MKGAASVVLETGDHPALLKDAVTTPAGCTIDGILELEEGKLRVTLIKAVVKATQRAANCCSRNRRVANRSTKAHRKTCVARAPGTHFVRSCGTMPERHAMPEAYIPVLIFALLVLSFPFSRC